MKDVKHNTDNSLECWCNPKIEEVSKDNYIVIHNKGTYKRGHHCNNCRFFNLNYETVYNPHHNGEPGSTDYEIEIRLCCRNCDEEHNDCIELSKIKYSCKFFQSNYPEFPEC